MAIVEKTQSFNLVPLFKVVQPVPGSTHTFDLTNLDYIKGTANPFVIELEFAPGFDFDIGIMAIEQFGTGRTIELMPKGGVLQNHIRNNRFIHPWDTRDYSKLITEAGDYVVKIECRGKRHGTGEEVTLEEGFAVRFEHSLLDVAIIQPANGFECTFADLMSKLRDLEGEIIEGAPPFAYEWEIANSSLAVHIIRGTTPHKGRFIHKLVPDDYTHFAVGDNVVKLKVTQHSGASIEKTHAIKITPNKLKVLIVTPKSNARVHIPNLKDLNIRVKVEGGTPKYNVKLAIDREDEIIQTMETMDNEFNIDLAPDLKRWILENRFQNIGPHEIVVKLSEASLPVEHIARVIIIVAMDVAELRKLLNMVLGPWDIFKTRFAEFDIVIKDLLKNYDLEIRFLPELKDLIRILREDITTLDQLIDGLPKDDAGRIKQLHDCYSNIAGILHRIQEEEGLRLRDILDALSRVTLTVERIDRRIMELNIHLIKLIDEGTAAIEAVKRAPAYSNTFYRSNVQARQFFEVLDQMELFLNNKLKIQLTTGPGAGAGNYQVRTLHEIDGFVTIEKIEKQLYDALHQGVLPMVSSIEKTAKEYSEYLADETRFASMSADEQRIHNAKYGSARKKQLNRYPSNVKGNLTIIQRQIDEYHQNLLAAGKQINLLMQEFDMDIQLVMEYENYLKKLRDVIDQLKL